MYFFEKEFPRFDSELCNFPDEEVQTTNKATNGVGTACSCWTGSSAKKSSMTQLKPTATPGGLGTDPIKYYQPLWTLRWILSILIGCFKSCDHFEPIRILKFQLRVNWVNLGWDYFTRSGPSLWGLLWLWKMMNNNGCSVNCQHYCYKAATKPGLQNKSLVDVSEHEVRQIDGE